MSGRTIGVLVYSFIFGLLHRYDDLRLAVPLLLLLRTSFSPFYDSFAIFFMGAHVPSDFGAVSAYGDTCDPNPFNSRSSLSYSHVYFEFDFSRAHQVL